jgi:sensor domain CHASE-containing protein
MKCDRTIRNKLVCITCLLKQIFDKLQSNELDYDREIRTIMESSLSMMVSALKQLVESWEEIQMTKKKPSFRGDGIAIWENKDKNKNPYLTVQLLGSIRVNAFPIREDKEE